MFCAYYTTCVAILKLIYIIKNN